MTARELLVIERDGRRVLAAPEVGTFTCALPKGRLCSPGMDAGVIRTLGRATSLVIPAGVTGRIVSDPPERVHEPVGYGDPLYELAPLDVDGGELDADAAAGGAESAGRVFAAPHPGRFWHRAAPGEPPLVEPGDVLEDGVPVGLIEVMKTFGRVPYRPGDGLPARARVVRLVAADGAEVNRGDPLLEVEPA